MDVAVSVAHDWSMNVILVSNSRGERRVRWRNVILLGLGLAAAIGVGMGSAYALLAGEWRALPILMGIGSGVGLVTHGVLSGLRTPLERLSRTD